MGRRIATAAGVTVVVLGLCGWLAGRSSEAVGASWSPPAGLPPPRPDCQRALSPGANLQAAVDTAPEGAVLCLAEGRYDGPLEIRRRVQIWGPAGASIVSNGVGTTINVLADGSALLGFSVNGSGGRYDINDAAVRVEAADVRIEGLHIRGALFGILAEDSTRLVVRGNAIVGDTNREVGIGMRGDGIRFWSTTDSLVEGNELTFGRDVVMWYSARNRLVGNRVTDGRYGTHFMYSHDCAIEDNYYERNVVGVFIMYTHGIRLTGNLFSDHYAVGGMGLGLKDSGGILVRGNRFVHNRTSLHLDNSPSDLERQNLFEDNAIRLSEVGVFFHASQAHNRFEGNRFADNLNHVQVSGGGDALAVDFHGNDFDDYTGYDLDGDGYGELPYELRSLSNQLTSQRPQLVFFRGTPSLWLVDVAGEISPLLRPQTIVRDDRPRVGMSQEPDGHAN